METEIQDNIKKEVEYIRTKLLEIKEKIEKTKQLTKTLNDEGRDK
jgi:sensor domain CHASE-containing protein